MTAGATAIEVIEDILDVMFPAEKAAADILTVLLDNVDAAVRSRGMKTVVGLIKCVHVVRHILYLSRCFFFSAHFFLFVLYWL